MWIPEEKLLPSLSRGSASPAEPEAGDPRLICVSSAVLGALSYGVFGSVFPLAGRQPDGLPVC